MRRGDATISARQDMRYADALQTRSCENAMCRVPRIVSRLSEGSVVGIIIIWTGAAAPMRTSPPGNCVRSVVGRDPKLRYTSAENTLRVAVSPKS